jgi:DNA-binding NarL/FixJ family response regulator
MKNCQTILLASADRGLLNHWERVLGNGNKVISSFDQIRLAALNDAILWLDLNLPNIPHWTSDQWIHILKHSGIKVIATSSSPTDNEGIQALDAGCVAYCHAYSDTDTLLQVNQVVKTGHVWVGISLMQRLIQGAGRFAQPTLAGSSSWDQEITQREREVAVLAANGASNQHIAENCNISERTVKAHLSSVFAKLNITDRLQLALRVHGIS